MARVLISGALGLIGSALCPAFRERGNDVTTLTRRRATNSTEREWHPEVTVSPELVSGFDAVIHLSGENVAGRWTKSKKQRIRHSRVLTTRNLSEALAISQRQPTVFVCASAIGYYGNRGDQVLTEASPAGEGFFPDLCHDWEAATNPAQEAGIRVIHLRTGIVLSRSGGALRQMTLPFKLGLGGRIGSGRQWWSWIHIEDFVRAVLYIPGGDQERERGQASSDEILRGAVNMAAPTPVTNAEFTKALGSALHRPAILPVPAFAARLAVGEFADHGLLSSARVIPRKLLESGFQFKFSELGAALADLTGHERTS